MATQTQKITMRPEPLPFDEKFLREKLQNDPSDWQTRRQLAHGLYDKESFDEAAAIVWMADEIPSTDLELAFAARILSKSQPRKAIRLLTAVLVLNRGKAVQNLGMANALLHHGMVLQAARFYGAALEIDPALVNPDLEHFILWTDDELALWGDFTNRRPKLGTLPWMARDPKEALKLTSRVSLHTTPISVPNLPVVAGEQLRQELYQQEAKKNGKITPPPAVTIPIDRVDPKHRRFDSTYGATVVASAVPMVPLVVSDPPVPDSADTSQAADASSKPHKMVTPQPVAASFPGPAGALPTTSAAAVHAAPVAAIPAQTVALTPPATMPASPTRRLIVPSKNPEQPPKPVRGPKLR